MILSSHICPACGTTNPQQAAFCFGCGKPLPTSLSASSLRKALSVQIPQKVKDRKALSTIK